MPSSLFSTHPEGLSRAALNSNPTVRRSIVGAISGALMVAALLGAGSPNFSYAYPIVGDTGAGSRAAQSRQTPSPPATATPTSPSPAAVPSTSLLGTAMPDRLADRATPSSRGGVRSTAGLSANEKFIVTVAAAAQESQLETKVPAAVTIAQAILESDWGRSLLATKGNNYFGIKATSGPGPAGVINMNTWEVLSGQNVVVNDGFKAYHNLQESVLDHGRFLANNARYAAAFKVTDDPKEFARRIRAAGYATDPAYSTKLINLMDKFNLYQYDQ